MKLTRLTPDDFDQLANKTEMGPDARMMAKGFLVERRTLTEVASQYNVSKQRVHLAVETIRKEYARSKLNTGLLELELELPHTLAVDIERFAKAFSLQADTGLRQAALVKIARAIASAEHSLEN
ncbi:TrfB-related DNA-binding protein [Massilia sp. CCM 8734]|uniref:TrfB-related DNA-binding protein n=1 Tax=Massilia sp. CCM 8734 TaxID=2609283 RepID=UPI00141F4704|nr:TrfB-related DNA-binding protein [Massilia sp. CCM 8734]NHZ99076.1 hypothetical protein [Massilia sp. CCM 8734]